MPLFAGTGNQSGTKTESVTINGNLLGKFSLQTRNHRFGKSQSAVHVLTLLKYILLKQSKLFTERIPRDSHPHSP